jgi:hypothetical protein
VADLKSIQDKETASVSFHTPTISDERRVLLENVLEVLRTSGVSQRETLDNNLGKWSNLYDMRVQPKNTPWPNSANLPSTLIPTSLDTLTSRLMQLVVPSRLFVVKGRDPESEQYSHVVEHHYNTQLQDNEWDNSIYHYAHLSGRDGTSVMEVVWEKRIHYMNLVQFEDAVDEAGVPIYDEAGNPKQNKKVVKKAVTEYNGVKWNPVELRDFFLFPAWARSIEEAPTVARVLYLSEAELWAMVRSGDLRRDAVARMIADMKGAGEELPQDEHRETYEIGGQIDVTTTEHILDPKMQQASYFKVWRFHTREFDLDHDGIFEENIIFFHEYTKRVLGIQYYQYGHGYRPFIELSLMDRPNRFYGYSVCERLYAPSVEQAAIHNQRLDEINLRLSPPILRRIGAQYENKDKPWGPGTIYDVGDLQDMKLMELPDVPPSSWSEEQLINQYAKELIGLADAFLASGGSRQTRYAQQLAAAAVTVRLSLMASRFQRALRRIFKQTHELTLQYGPAQVLVHMPAPKGPQPQQQPQLAGELGQELAPEQQPQQNQQVVIDKRILGLDYELGINGMGSPLDKTQRRQELLFLYNLLMQNPLLKASLRRIWALTQKVLEEFDISDTMSVIGTEQDAVQLEQALLKAQQNKPPDGGGGGAKATPGGNRQSRRQATRAGDNPLMPFGAPPGGA